MTSPIPKSAPTKREALRLLLADGKWHHMSELRKAGGWRYGARLEELRREIPGLETPKRRVDGNDTEFEYCAVFPTPVAQLQLLPPALPKRRSPKKLIAELIQENASLKRRVAELEGAGASA